MFDCYVKTEFSCGRWVIRNSETCSWHGVDPARCAHLEKKAHGKRYVVFVK